MTRYRKDDLEFHKLLKQMAQYSYRKDGGSLPQGYEVLKSVDNPKTGFYADILKKGDNIVIAYRGTNNRFGKDGLNDVAMARSRMPAQATDALRVYDEISELYKDNPNIKITTTGHSLGGSLSQIVGGMRGAESVSFNAYGVRDLFKDPKNLKTDNIVNYINEKDSIPMANAGNHIGESYSVLQNPEYSNRLDIRHQTEALGDLTTRTLRTAEELEKQKLRLHPNLQQTQNNIHNISKSYNDFKSNIKQTIQNSLQNTNIKQGFDKIQQTINSSPINSTIQTGLKSLQNLNPIQNNNAMQNNSPSNSLKPQSNFAPKSNFAPNQNPRLQELNMSWGNMGTTDLFRSLYKNRNLDDMTKWQIERMLDDLI